MNLSVNTHNVHFSSKRKLHFPLAICLIENSYNEHFFYSLSFKEEAQEEWISFVLLDEDNGQ